MENKEYDFVIIGGGVGGLGCAYILADEGHSVAVLEKNPQLGGSIQIFSRDKCVLDTGLHYMGGLSEGQNLYQFFKYYDLIGKIKLRQMDMDGFDWVHQGKEDKFYKYAQGYDNFIEGLVADFPEEREAIQKYCDVIRDVCTKFPLYMVQNVEGTLHDMEVLSKSAYEFIQSITENERLRMVLSGNNPLYVGVKDKTPLYVHALVTNSYIESSWRCVDGGSQIATQMARNIRAKGGEVFKRADVVSAEYNEDGTVSAVNLKDGRKFHGKNFISNVHPLTTVEMFGADHFRKSYVNRLQRIENTVSSFTVHLIFKEQAFPYMNHNIYHMKDGEDVWELSDYDEATWPQGFMFCTPASSKSEEFAESASIMCYMKYDEVAQWQDTFNTVGEVNERGESYDDFKRKKEELVIQALEDIFPDIRSKIQSVYSSTPLTFRDYIGNPDGSLYGTSKDHDSPLKTFINPRTKVPNLFLTGQNINLHGVLGATVNAFTTCFEFIEPNKLIQKVRDAQ